MSGKVLDPDYVAGSRQDYADAKRILEIYQDEVGIKPPQKPPIFDAVTLKTRASTITLTEPLRPQLPTAWIDVYHPELDTPAGGSVNILDKKGKSVWKADLDEDGDPLDEDAHEYEDSFPAWHRLVPLSLVRPNDPTTTFEHDGLLHGGFRRRGRALAAAVPQEPVVRVFQGWYGATTLPALTEAIVIDKDATAAKHEVSRLVKLFEALTEQTRPRFD
ncbi:Vacuolar protein sorting-associated protein 70 [Marasmius sp. AFHP31]|nr:Vacuolar protein sorting-associated protein 70 [Marasmius sp. AFHP31]